MANDRLADKLFRLNAPYGAAGLASYAVSAVDLALWDARAKLLDMPVYQLAGGPQKDKLFCYATGNDVDWYQELGFKAFKLACPYGPADGLDGLRKNEEFVAKTREQIGDDCELMLDCWMAFDIEYTVRLAETLRPYRLKWIEEYLLPDDFDAHVAVRQRLPWQTLATGEHWYTAYPFQWAVNHHAVDILQPDINWVGGFSTCQKIAAMAQAANINVILHGGGNTAYGQHFSYASAARAVAGVLRRHPAGRAAGGRVAASGPGDPGGWLPRPQRRARLRPGDSRRLVRAVLRVARTPGITRPPRNMFVSTVGADPPERSEGVSARGSPPGCHGLRSREGMREQRPPGARVRLCSLSPPLRVPGRPPLRDLVMCSTAAGSWQ